MRIRLFDRVEAVSDDGASLDVGPAKCQAVLAALALSAGSSVPTWQLVESVWGEDPPRTAERTLQSYIARLRRELGQDAITRTGAAYRLNLPAGAVDVLRFERHLGEGDVEAALVEWTGTPLAGLDAPGLDAAVAGLTERWLAATELDLERRVEADPASTVAELTELTAGHPFREGLWALLMTALYRVGRQADALAAYRTARSQLVEQLGVEPSKRLQELEMQILRHDQHLDAGQARVSVGAAGPPTGIVTFAFTQIDDATRLWAEDRQAMSRSLAGHRDMVEDLVSRHGGHVFNRAGDGFGLAFHRAGAAVAWADDLQRASGPGAHPGGLDLGVCIGIHTGEAEEHRGGYFGPAVNIAVQLSAAGHGGQTLISDATAGFLDDVELRDLGMYRLEEIVAEQRIHQLGHADHLSLRLEGLHQGNLPHRLGRLIGRDHDLDTIVDALTTYPVVTLVGPGGIGKTRLALAAAERAAPEGDAWLVELAEVDSPDQVSRAVADTLDVAEQPGTSLIQTIVYSLQRRRVLLVLDNCEHVVEGAAQVAEALARGCEQARVVATSRERLAVNNERIVTVPPLDPASSAIELFDERAAAVSATYRPGVDRSAIEEICRRLDGIPLAVELAAARTISLSPAELADRLGHRLRLSGGTRRSGSDRHRTLRSAIQWSYDLLTASERTVFGRLAIFTGPLGLAAAEHVASGADLDVVEVADVLDRLVDQSMLAVESGPFGRRFRLLEPIREFAADQLDEPTRSELARRHAEWCLSEVTEIHRLLAGWGEIEGVARLTELWPNLRSAFHWACDTGDRDLARSLVRPILSEIILRSNYEIGDWLEQLLAITPPEDEDGLIFGLYWAAHRYSVTQHPAGYQRLVDRYGEPDHPLMHHGRATAEAGYQAMAEWAPTAVEKLRQSGDDHLAERAEINVATAWLNLGRYEECDARLELLFDRYRTQGPPTFVNWTLLLLGYSASFQGRQDLADSYFDNAIAVEVPPGTHSPNKPLEARAAFRRGNRIRAFRILESHIEELLPTDNMQAGSIVCIEFINMMAQIGRLAEAGRMLAYLETTGLLDAPAWRTLIDDSAKIIASAPDAAGAADGDDSLEGRQALEYMRDVLHTLTTDDPSAHGQ